MSKQEIVNKNLLLLKKKLILQSKLIEQYNELKEKNSRLEKENATLYDALRARDNEINELFSWKQRLESHFFETIKSFFNRDPSTSVSASTEPQNIVTGDKPVDARGNYHHRNHENWDKNEQTRKKELFEELFCGPITPSPILSASNYGRSHVSDRGVLVSDETRKEYELNSLKLKETSIPNTIHATSIANTVHASKTHGSTPSLNGTSQTSQYPFQKDLRCRMTKSNQHSKLSRRLSQSKPLTIRKSANNTVGTLSKSSYQKEKDLLNSSQDSDSEFEKFQAEIEASLSDLEEIDNNTSVENLSGTNSTTLLNKQSGTLVIQDRKRKRDGDLLSKPTKLAYLRGQYVTPSFLTLSNIDMIRGVTPVKDYVSYLIYSLLEKYDSWEKTITFSEQYRSDLKGIAWNLLYMCDRKFDIIVDRVFNYATHFISKNSIMVLILIELFANLKILGTETNFVNIVNLCFHRVQELIFPNQREESLDTCKNNLTFLSMLSGDDTMSDIMIPRFLALVSEILMSKDAQFSLQTIPYLYHCNKLMKNGVGPILEAIRLVIVSLYKKNPESTVKQLIHSIQADLESVHGIHSTESPYQDRIKELVEKSGITQISLEPRMLWEMIKAITIYCSQLSWSSVYDSIISDVLWNLLNHMNKKNDVLLFVLYCIDRTVNQRLVSNEWKDSKLESMELQALHDRLFLVQSLDELPAANIALTKKISDMTLHTLKSAISLHFKIPPANNSNIE